MNWKNELDKMMNAANGNFEDYFDDKTKYRKHYKFESYSEDPIPEIPKPNTKFIAVELIKYHELTKSKETIISHTYKNKDTNIEHTVTIKVSKTKSHWKVYKILERVKKWIKQKI